MIQLNAPIFLNVEFSRSFVKEYPVCAAEKNVVMPYPSTDPEMLGGQMDFAYSSSFRSPPPLLGSKGSLTAVVSIV